MIFRKSSPAWIVTLIRGGDKLRLSCATMTDFDAGKTQTVRPDQATRRAVRLVDVGAPSRRTLFLRWFHRTPLAKVVGTGVFLSLAAASLIIATGSLLMMGLATLEWLPVDDDLVELGAGGRITMPWIAAPLR